jgi:hypothetical protein
LNGDGAPGCEGIVDFLQQFAAALFAFAVKDVAQDDDIVSGAEVRRGKVTRNKAELVVETEAGDGFLCDGQNARPVKRSNAHAGATLRERDAPDTGAGTEIEHMRFVETQLGGEGLRRSVAHGKNLRHQPFEEFGSNFFLVH